MEQNGCENVMQRFIWMLFTLALATLNAAPPARANEKLPPCPLRPLQVEKSKPLWVDNDRFCAERVFALPPGEDDALALTALAFGDDGALYATAPRRGEVWRFVDTDGDTLPDLETAEVILSGLRRPNALAWRDGALYVVASERLIRWQPAGSTETLIEDLPTGGGFWNGGLAFDAEGRAYVGIGAPCSICATFDLAEPVNPRATILRIPPGGSWEIYASGLRQPAGLAWAAGALWATDTRDAGQPDLLYRIEPGGDHGWPACAYDLPACTEPVPPALALPPGSVPLALVHYEGAAFPELSGSLLLALAGDPHARLTESGFALAAVSLTRSGAPLALEYLAPQWSDEEYPSERYPSEGYPSRVRFALLNTGIWPRQIFGVAVDGNGWIYFSLSGGQIFVLRPP